MLLARKQGNYPTTLPQASAGNVFDLYEKRKIHLTPPNFFFFRHTFPQINHSITILKTTDWKYTLIFVELRKFAKRLEEISPNNILEGFLFFLRHIHSLGKQPQEFQQQIWDHLFEAAQIAAMNHKDRQTYIKKMNSERDRINQWEYAMEQAKTEGLARGLAEGRAKGKAEEKILIAKNLKFKSIPYETIAQCTGLTIEEIEKL